MTHGGNNRDSMVRAAAALATLMELRNPSLLGHSERVAEYAVLLASELALADADVHAIRLAGLLHDLGRLALPDGLIEKAASTSEAETDLIMGHVQAGVNILSPLLLGGEVVDAVKAHHERWDGKGYPRGLKGEEIPLGGRILAIADAFDSMMSARPGRPALSLKNALNEIYVNMGAQFDPVLASTFLRRILKGTKVGGGEAVAPAPASTVGVSISGENVGEAYMSARVLRTDPADRGEITLQFAERGDASMPPIKAGQVITLVYVVGQSTYKRLYRVSSGGTGSLEYTCEPVGDLERLGARVLASVDVSIPGRQWPLYTDSRAGSGHVGSSAALGVVIKEVGISTVAYELGEGQAPHLHRVSVGMQVALEFELPPVGAFEGGRVKVGACIYADPFHPIPGTPPRYRAELVDIDAATEQLFARFVFAAQAEARRRRLTTDSPSS